MVDPLVERVFVCDWIQAQKAEQRPDVFDLVLDGRSGDSDSPICRELTRGLGGDGLGGLDVAANISA
jgi:hypothetical protein